MTNITHNNIDYDDIAVIEGKVCESLGYPYSALTLDLCLDDIESSPIYANILGVATSDRDAFKDRVITEILKLITN